MQVVTLEYTKGGTTYSRDYPIYSVNPWHIRLQRTEHRTFLGFVEDSVGYRFVFDVHFAPLDYDKEAIFWLYGFMFGDERLIIYIVDGNAYSAYVTPDADSLDFDFAEEMQFNNSFHLNLTDITLRLVEEDLSTRVLRPTYNPSEEGISGDVLTKYCNLVDEISIEARRQSIVFANGNPSDVSWGYTHKFICDLDMMYQVTHRDWILRYALCPSKQLDTRLIDPVNGLLYDVVLDTNDLAYEMQNGIVLNPSLVIQIKEKTIRTEAEQSVVEGALPFITDDDVTDDQPLGA
jgi:hypothetical protein